jgi:GLPGLI family protein
MKKLSLLFALAITISQNVHGQFGGIHSEARDYERKTIIDTCVLRIVYEHSFARDTTGNMRPYTDRKNVDVGRKITHYYSSYTDMYDSIAYEIRTNPEPYRPKNPHADFMIPGMTKIIDLEPQARPQYEDVFINYPERTMLTNIMRYNLTDYIYHEAEERISWELADDDNAAVTILGYDCVKAVCFFKGRKWEAWFTPKIPVSAGPWKLCGLPGLILRARDERGLFEWTATGLKASGEMYVYGYEGESMPAGQRKLNLKQPDIVKNVTKKDVDRIRELSWSDPISLLVAHGVLSSGQANFYDGGKMTVIKPGELSYPYIPTLELE